MSGLPSTGGGSKGRSVGATEVTKATALEQDVPTDGPAADFYREQTTVAFTNPPRVSPEVAAVYLATPDIFIGLKLSNRRVLARCQRLLDRLDPDPKARYGRTHLVALCGQDNSDTAQILKRNLFIRLPVPIDMRNGGGYEYCVYPKALAELRRLVEVETQLRAAKEERARFAADCRRRE